MNIDKNIIRKAVIVNSLLTLYFICPNLSSFLGIIFLFSLLIQSQPYGFLGTNIQIFSNEPHKYLNIDFLHKKYNKFLNSSITKQIFTVLGLYILTKVCWYIPSWLFLVVIGEVYVAWDVLKSLGVFELVQSYINLAKQSVQKFVDMIPKHQA